MGFGLSDVGLNLFVDVEISQWWMSRESFSWSSSSVDTDVMAKNRLMNRNGLFCFFSRIKVNAAS